MKFKITWRRKRNPVCGRNCFFRCENGDEYEEKCFLGFGSWDEEEGDLKPGENCLGPGSYELKEIDDG